MRIARLGFVLAAVTFAVPASAQSFLGEWRASAQAGDMLISETLTVAKTADGFSVTVKDVDPPSPAGMVAGPGVDVKLEGDAFSYRRIITTPDGGTIEIIYKGTVTGDMFTGTGELQGFAVPYNGVRISKPN